MNLLDAAFTLLELTRDKLRTITVEDRVRKLYLSYLERMLVRIEASLALINEEDAAPSAILARSSLECFIDLANLAKNPDYLVVLRAMLLEEQSSVFHFRTQPMYDMLVEDLGEEEVRRMAKRRNVAFKESLREATICYPIIRDSSRNLSVINRFRMAGLEVRYQTEYSWLSMQAHNSIGTLVLEESMADIAPAMEAAQIDVERTMVLHFLVEMLVDNHKNMDHLFGHDEEFTRAFLYVLSEGEHGGGIRKS